MSLIPETLGRNDWIDWIPVDHLSTIILELAGISTTNAPREDSGLRVFHCVNPNRVLWKDALLPVIQSRLARKNNVAIVSLKQWIEALEKAANEVNTAEEAKVSAFKLVPFLASLPQGHARPEFDTSKTRKESLRLRELPKAGAEWTNSWLNQWGY